MVDSSFSLLQELAAADYIHMYSRAVLCKRKNLKKKSTREKISREESFIEQDLTKHNLGGQSLNNGAQESRAR